ncbi:uncharacterized protein BDW47DRAFT_7091 [Aspergillus candidus]|uniref:FAD/NAD(P)-binding domain-containing protein n=1 Tax=Aspergillus candidus TaxID=41067 RepID=A0A2I2EXS2_ASPCN|nr:FAD/NAD(P)-binding domain-containing protein [Aspergillus candidus]PLB33185.1 FAD/NAD(P)-binding domain-containing protein [Aspergillus candidus]
MGGQSKKSVAVIGSGMAGLVSAYLLQRDREQRYTVEVFEMQDQLSLDSASYTVPPGDDDDDDDSPPCRIDIPMRALDDGFHNNLKRMYDYLDIKYSSPKFIYPLSSISTDRGAKKAPYYIHSSSNHMVPPLRPEGRGYVTWILQMVFLAVCYFWFTACCFLVRPNPATKSSEDESFGQYLERIRLPRKFVRSYLLPLMSSITTCPHDALLEFPAIDCTEYARRTYRQPHFTVDGGVQNVQTRITEGQTIRLGATVTAVETIGAKVRVTWTDSSTKDSRSNDFDHVIMAVTPNVISAIYKPLQDTLDSIPVTSGESVVHRDLSTIPKCDRALKKIAKKSHPESSTKQPQLLHICSNDSSTESTHTYSSSILVTNFPITPIDPSKVIHRARLARVLRTPGSRKIVNRIFDIGASKKDDERVWRNGDGNVWLAGAWCWDGMVLLEGCVVSAMRVATSLGVEVPWMTEE